MKLLVKSDKEIIEIATVMGSAPTPYGNDYIGKGKNVGIAGFTLYVPCQHFHTTFWGMYSLIGNYKCDDCGIEIDPKTYHQLLRERGVI